MEYFWLLLYIFATFFKIGLFSFGGGMGVIALLQQEVANNGWMTEDMFLNFVAISESTPGPIAINIATFIGSTLGGFLGSVVATLGVILPAFVIILLIAIAFKNFQNNRYVQAFLKGLKPVTLGLIAGMGISMVVKAVGFSIKDFQIINNFSIFNLVILGALIVIYVINYIIRKKHLSPIWMIVISAALGIICYGI